jgi:hypothetical protein
MNSKEIENLQQFVTKLCMSLVVLGLFASFAQNGYGLPIAGFGLVMLSLFYAFFIYDSYKKDNYNHWLNLSFGFCSLLMIITTFYTKIDFQLVQLVLYALALFASGKAKRWFKKNGYTSIDDRKKYIAQVERTCIFFISLGIGGKLMQQTGASFLSVTGFIYAMVYGIKNAKKTIQNAKVERTTKNIFNVVIWLFFITCCIHFFTGVSGNSNTSFFNSTAWAFLAIILFSLSVGKINKNYSYLKLSSFKFSSRFIFLLYSFMAFNIYSILNSISFMPNLVDQKYPFKYKTLSDNSNILTSEGKILSKKLKKYKKNYINFIESRSDSNDEE